MLTLGIETSCDETAVAVVEEGRTILANALASSRHFHERYGGVIPEIACRYHVEQMTYVLKEALRQAHVTLDELGLIAVTQGPGLASALLVGISLAKALALSRQLPLIGVSHLEAHLHANMMYPRPPAYPYVGLIVSGGHTILVLVRDLLHREVLGETRDDAAGEAFDKVARVLGLGYPGGPLIERRARDGDPQAIRFPRGLNHGTLDFSFSGVKTAVLYYMKAHKPTGSGEASDSRSHKPTQRTIADVAASFQEAVVDTLVQKVRAACHKTGCRRVVVGGGVSANLRLRERLQALAKAEGMRLWVPPMSLCIDNAAMIAGLGHALYRAGKRSDLELTALPELAI